MTYAKGNFDTGSDVDLAFFSDYFEEKSRVETFLLLQAMEYQIDLEPVAFSGKEYEERQGIVDEIINTGVEIQILQDQGGAYQNRGYTYVEDQLVRRYLRTGVQPRAGSAADEHGIEIYLYDLHLRISIFGRLIRNSILPSPPPCKTRPR